MWWSGREPLEDEVLACLAYQVLERFESPNGKPAWPTRFALEHKRDGRC
jgi:tRNA uridine 5-carbamoylmethylation protein Kti12